MGFTLIAVLSYQVIGGEMSSRLVWGLSGGMPADGYVILPVGEFASNDQTRVASMPGVSGCEFAAVANVILPSGGGQIEGVDFASPFFDFVLSQGRLPSAQGEAVVDSVLSQLGDWSLGKTIEVSNANGDPFNLTVVGVLSATARAPSGLLVSRDYCLSSEVGAKLNRVWITVTAGANADPTALARDIAAGFRHASFATRQTWSAYHSDGVTVGQGILASLMGALVLSTLLILWVLGRAYFIHGAASIWICYALGVSSGGLRWIALADALVSGAVGATVLGACLALRPNIGAGLVIAGPWWLIFVATVLPALATLVLSLMMKPAVRYEQ